MLLTHQPCPSCGSSDALTQYDDGQTHCFSCKTHKGSSQQEAVPKNYITGTLKDIPERNLNKETCRRFRYTTKIFKGRPCEIATYKDFKGRAIWQKVRYTDDKEFFINKFTRTAEPFLWGCHLCGGANRRIFITEGEIDCMSVSQAFDNKYPVVSVPNGAAAAKKAIKYNIEWLNKFNEIVIIFDNDEPGRKAAEECAELLPVGKVKIATLPEKDPSEMLKKGMSKTLEECIWRAREYRPDGVISGNNAWEEVKKPIKWGLSYPFPALTNLTYGVHKPSFILIGAGTGIGKTAYLTAFEKHFNQTTNEKIGIIHLEQQIKETCLYFLSQSARIPLFKPDIEIKEEKLKEYFDTHINNGRLFFYNAFGTKDFEIIKNIIRYLVVKEGCGIIALDHISAFASGIKAGTGDVNQAMKNISSELAGLTRELNFILIANSHLRKSSGKSWEDGAKPTVDDFEGSGDITKWTDLVLAIQRNKNAKGDEKNISYIHCLKDRFSGKADGAAIKLKYDPDTCQLTEAIEKNEVEEFTNAEEI